MSNEQNSTEARGSQGRYLFSREVAELLRVSLATVYNMINRGALPVIKLSQRVTLIPSEELDAMLASQHKV